MLTQLDLIKVGRKHTCLENESQFLWLVNNSDNIVLSKVLARNDGYGVAVLLVTNDREVYIDYYTEGDVTVTKVNIDTLDLEKFIDDNEKYYDSIISYDEVEHIINVIEEVLWIGDDIVE